MSRTGFITSNLSLRLLVRRGFLNISNEGGLCQECLVCFLFLSHTPLQLCSPVVFSDGRCATILEFSSLSNLRARSVSLHRLGVVRQTSLQSRATMMMYSNSPAIGGGG